MFKTHADGRLFGSRQREVVAILSESNGAMLESRALGMLASKWGVTVPLARRVVISMVNRGIVEWATGLTGFNCPLTNNELEAVRVTGSEYRNDVVLYLREKVNNEGA